MSIFQAVILGLVQGLTELLPVSSSGHLIVVPALFGWEPHSLAFDATLHLGTALALIVFFWKDLWKIITDLFLDLIHLKFQNLSGNSKIGIYIILGSVPAGVVGFFIGDLIEASFRSVAAVAVFVLLGTVLMIVAEKVSKKILNGIENLGFKNSLVIGMYQVLALFPGVSRSGATISGGMLKGLTRYDAAKFSFLLSIPIVLFAGGLKLIFIAKSMDITIVFGFISSFLSGMLAIYLLMNLLKKYSFKPFIIYRLFLVLTLILFVTFK